MADPIIELIAKNISAKINEIKQSNGFSEDLTAIRPKTLDFKDITPNDRVVLIVQENEIKPGGQGCGAIAWHQNFVIMAFIINSEKSEAPLDTRRNCIRADIQKKLVEDVTRDGNAYDTELMDSAFFDDGISFSGIVMNVIVKYRVKEDDPYTKG